MVGVVGAPRIQAKICKECYIRPVWRELKMKKRILGIAAPVLLQLPTQASFADTKIIHAGELLTVAGQSPARNQTIVIKDDRIVEVKSGFADVSEFDGDVKLIDLSDQFVLPGLMDMHVHLQGELGPDNDSENLKM